MCTKIRNFRFTQAIYDSKLVDLTEGLEYRFFIFVQARKVLHRTVSISDRSPHLFGVLPFLFKQFLEISVFNSYFHLIDIFNITIGPDRFDTL